MLVAQGDINTVTASGGYAGIGNTSLAKNQVWAKQQLAKIKTFCCQQLF